MNYDHIIGIDPGYGTQGIAILDCPVGSKPQFSTLCSSITESKVFPSHHERCDAQIDIIEGALGTARHTISNSLAIIEEWRTNPKARNNVTSYQRGFYDAVLRLRMQRICRTVITVNPIWVNQYSNPKGKFTKGAENPSAIEILTYVQMSCPWLSEFEAAEWLLERGTVIKLSLEGYKYSRSEKNKIHYADAAIMAVMGYIAAADPMLAAGRPPHQKDITQKMCALLKAAAINDTR